MSSPGGSSASMAFSTPPRLGVCALTALADSTASATRTTLTTLTTSRPGRPLMTPPERRLTAARRSAREARPEHAPDQVRIGPEVVEGGDVARRQRGALLGAQREGRDVVVGQPLGD